MKLPTYRPIFDLASNATAILSGYLVPRLGQWVSFQGKRLQYFGHDGQEIYLSYGRRLVRNSILNFSIV